MFLVFETFCLDYNGPVYHCTRLKLQFSAALYPLWPRNWHGIDLCIMIDQPDFIYARLGKWSDICGVVGNRRVRL